MARNLVAAALSLFVLAPETHVTPATLEPAPPRPALEAVATDASPATSTPASPVTPFDWECPIGSRAPGWVMVVLIMTAVA
ncbi:MAG: hypothetical protein JO329_06455 [Planctomycetaceae bacterium]|nr:hypothetical protein [Planctomycetaceae bacterium]